MTQRQREGYLLIDHRAGEGVGEALAGGKVSEWPTYTCSHCQRIVVINPDRKRDRGYCPKCDHLVCDHCEGARVQSGGACRPFEQIADEALERAIKGLPYG